ncbi:mitochondrial carrier domain-containing protein [Blyttiomyces helicus]|uniref:Mitochondrial carrier domain-containing protein n=1 Tax=Blyttiomyces helicus TaxID=388810 RepID=A0A4P9WBV4_9FUNG|nr:mitochondrial carrier domain-containing protein [Blyttiomyces helicus]|eukprot:RKO90109.1 mitochondrial carrier domain-containing protein [Blyttiomyces helicus]
MDRGGSAAPPPAQNDRDPAPLALLLLHNEQFRSTIAGGIAGCVSAVVTCPLDLVKIRLQNRRLGAPASPGTLGLLTSIFRDEGLRGLYRGVVPTLCGYLPTWAIYFTVYDWGKSAFPSALGKADPDSLTHMLSAISAGLVSTAATNPFWVIRTRVMTQPARPTPNAPYYYTSIINAFTTILRLEGPKALYKGLTPSLIGVSHVALQFPLYERLKSGIKDRNLEQTGAASIGTPGILLASALSKMTASLITYPHEVIRTRLQTQSIATPTAFGRFPLPKYRGILQTARTILIEEGEKAFYKGFSVNLLRTVPASALTIWTYEVVLRKLTLWVQTQNRGG